MSHADTRKRGAAGERAMRNALAPLKGHGWTSLHDLTLGPDRTADIDAVLVGPTGVWTLEAKGYTGEATLSPRGRLIVGGKDRARAVDQAIDAARAVRVVLDVCGCANKRRRLVGGLCPNCEHLGASVIRPIVVLTTDPPLADQLRSGPGAGVVVCPPDLLVGILTDRVGVLDRYTRRGIVADLRHSELNRAAS